MLSVWNDGMDVAGLAGKRRPASFRGKRLNKARARRWLHRGCVPVPSLLPSLSAPQGHGTNRVDPKGQSRDVSRDQLTSITTDGRPFIFASPTHSSRELVHKVSFLVNLPRQREVVALELWSSPTPTPR
jgi:hypothetical protein